MKYLSACFGLILASALGGTAAAHHSSAMFDQSNQRTLTGVVKQWNFTAPHSWLMVTVTQDDGKVVDWAFEGGGPSGAYRKDTFKPGDKVTVVTAPMRDGRPAGSLGEVTFADGRKAIQR
jgi:hypothetical protein